MDSTTQALVIDAHPESRARAAAELGRTHRVTAAADGAQAIAVASAETALIWLDHRLGGKWSLGCLSSLRACAAGATIVLVTDLYTVAVAVVALRAGADLVLARPVTAAQLLQAVRDRPRTSPASPVPTLARLEWEQIARAVADCDGNITHAARQLGMGRQSLQRRLRKHPPLV